MPNQYTPRVQCVCATCGTTFGAKPSEAATARYCSRPCTNAGRPRLPVSERLWRRVDRSGGPDACWSWQGATTMSGYGFIGIGTRPTRNVFAHRLAYELAHGPIPAGLFVCHRCDVKLCCNPAHLFVGTPRDNVADMVAKGRGGNGNSGARLTPDEVRAARHARADGESCRAIAARLGVNEGTIRELVSGRAWRHIV